MTGRARLADGRHEGIVRLAVNPRQRARLVARGPAQYLVNRRARELPDDIEHLPC
jgi:hypothetical protein